MSKKKQLPAPGQLPSRVPDGVKPEDVRLRAAMEMRSWRGPLPAPEDLAKYNDVSPEAVQVILGMAQKEQEHRHAREADQQMYDQQVALENVKTERRGQAAALVTVGTVGALSAWAFYLGQPVAAAGLCTAMLVSLVTAFLKGRAAQTQEPPAPPAPSLPPAPSNGPPKP